MTNNECEKLEKVSVRLAKTVRRINKFIDEGKVTRTDGSKTIAKFRTEVDANFLHAMKSKDPSGRVEMLLKVYEDISASELADWNIKVLADKWDLNAPFLYKPGKMGNVDFSEYAFTTRGFLAAGGEIDAPSVPREAVFSVVCGKVEQVKADAVVNAANEHLRAGTGICGAIFRRAGLAQLQAACDKVAPCPTGEARITPAFGITNAKYVIHAVGPRWYGGGRGEPGLLANCYRSLLKVAVDNGCKSVAIPSISTGVFGYPLEDAIKIAVREVKAFVANHPSLRVIFVVWDGDADGGAGTKKTYETELAGGC